MSDFENKGIAVLKAVNFIDSSLFGVSFDIFKVRILVSAVQSGMLVDCGFDNDFADLCFDFRRIRMLDFSIRKFEFGPPYLEDGDLSAINLLDFNFEELAFNRVGATIKSDREGVFREMQDEFEIDMAFNGAHINFIFADVVVF